MKNICYDCGMKLPITHDIFCERCQVNLCEDCNGHGFHIHIDKADCEIIGCIDPHCPVRIKYEMRKARSRL